MLSTNVKRNTPCSNEISRELYLRWVSEINLYCNSPCAIIFAKSDQPYRYDNAHWVLVLNHRWALLVSFVLLLKGMCYSLPWWRIQAIFTDGWILVIFCWLYSFLLFYQHAWMLTDATAWIRHNTPWYSVACTHARPQINCALTVLTFKWKHAS